MSNTIQIKRSSTASSVPTAGQLAQGELAVNLVDKKLYTKDNTNTVIQLNPEPPPAVTIASTGEAQAGTNNTNVITPLRMREGFNASGSAPVYACRAWVNFDGTTNPPTIRASGNVSSVTKTNSGRFVISFTTAMPDVNYMIASSAGRTFSNNPTISGCDVTANFLSTSFAFTTHTTGNSYIDVQFNFISVFR